MYQISPVESGFLSGEPGLMVTNSIGKLKPNRVIHVMIVNNTNKTYSIKKGIQLAKIEQVQGPDISSVPEASKQQKVRGSCENFEHVDPPVEHKQKIIELLKKNLDLFAQNDSDLCHTDTVKMKINTGDHPPIELRPYRTPLTICKVINNAVDEMLEAKIIERSKSPWSFPVDIVDMKDGSQRFCVDFRALNKVTKSNSYPLPFIDDILALLGQAKSFTSLDLKVVIGRCSWMAMTKRRQHLHAIGVCFSLT